MTNDNFLQLFNSESTTMDTGAFLNYYKGMILLSGGNSLKNILNRFMVKTITLHKHTATTSQHEYLTIEVHDTDSENSKTHLVFLERTAFEVVPDSTAIDEAFANHPDSPHIRDTIQAAVVGLLGSGYSAPAKPQTSNQDEIPLLAITPSSSRSSPPTPLSPSYMGVASLASTQAVHRSTESFLAKTRHARDHFVVGRQPSAEYIQGHVMRKHVPRDLSFFSLIVLASIVHDHDPLYSLLKRQCFWFANTIYLVVENLYRYETVVDIGDSSEQYDIRIPPGIYLPDSAGRWMGVLVTKVSEEVVRILGEKFQERYEKEQSDVRFFFLFQLKLY